MTEAEAKTKICCGPPFLANAVLVSGPAAHVTDSEVFGRCIGSACMAWRSHSRDAEQHRVLSDDEPPPGSDWTLEKVWDADPGRLLSAEPRILYDWKRELPAEGYCGLAGRIA